MGQRRRTMKIISLINSKGGVGKTTLCVNLAAYTQNHIYVDTDKCKNTRPHVLVVDADPQGSIRDWSEAGGSENQIVIALDNKSLMGNLETIAKNGNYDFVFIDTPGHMADISAAAIAISDMVIIPVQPSPYDLWATTDVVDLITQRQLISGGQPECRYLLNRCIPNSLICKDVNEYLHTCVFGHFSTNICQRVVYADTAHKGQTIFQSNNHVAIDEFLKLGDELMGVIDELRKKASKHAS